MNKYRNYFRESYKKYFQEIFPEIGLSFAINVAGAIFALCQQILLTNLMGSAHYGTYVYASTWILILSFIPRLGLDTCLLKYLAEYRAYNQWDFFFGILKKTHSFARVLSCFIVVVVILGIFLLRESLGVDLFKVFFIGSFAIPFAAFSRLYQATLQSTYKAIYALACNLLCFPALLCAITTLLYLSGHGVQSVDVMTSHVVALIIMNVMMMHVSGRALQKHCPSIKDIQYKTGEWLRAALPVFLISFLQLLLTRVDIVMVGWILDTQQSGLYAVSSVAASTVAFGISSAHAIVAPQISYLYHKNDMNGLQDILKKEMSIVLVMTCPIIAVLIFLGKPLLGMFGTAFLPGYTSLTILLIGQSLTTFMGSISFLMIVGEYQNILALFIASCVMVNILLNLFFIPLYGIKGAAWSNTTAMIMWNLCMYFFVKKHFWVDTTIFSILRRYKHS